MDVLLKKYFWVVNLLVIALCATLGGRAAAHLVEQNYLMGDDAGQPPPRPFVPPQEKVRSKGVDLIINRNVFCSSCTPEVEEAEAAAPSDPGGVKSSLPFELVSTMWVRSAPKWSMAVIRETGTKEKEAMTYIAGRELPGTTAKVARVDPKRVYILNSGNLEYFEIEGADQPKKAAAAEAPVVSAITPGMDPMDAEVQKSVRCNGNNCDVDRPLVDKLLSNTTSLATAARFVPSVKDGRPNGFKLYAIRPSSVFGKIGLQNGDTIKAINGMEMSSPDQALAVYSKLRSASHLTVAVERRGETVTLDYSIR